MLKILLVDDEKGTRDVIVKFIPWQELSITGIIEAEDGAQALSEALSHKPDILLTDIRMPKMNGIELAEKVRAFLPNCRIIFLTGYTDKEYLKAAIRYKAVSYVEKPLELNELVSVLRTAVKECMAEKEEHDRYIKDEIVTLCIDLTNSKTDIAVIENRIRALGIQFGNSDLYLTAVLQFQIADTEIPYEQDLIRYEFLERLKPCLTAFEGKYIAGFKRNDHFLIHYCMSSNEIETIISSMQGFLDEIRLDPLFTQIAAAIGTLEKGTKGIAVSYRYAIMALQQKFFKSTKKILQYTNDTSSPFILDEAWLVQLSEVLHRNNQIEAQIMVKRLSNDLRKCINTQPDYVRNIFFRIVMMLTMYAREFNIQLLNDECSFILDSISGAGTLDEIEAETLTFIKSVYTYMERNQNTGDPVSKVTEYIHKNYSNPSLSVNAISQNTFLTVSYLCVVFKKSTGKTINQYITEYRVAKARELLKTTGIRVQDIAERVGYTDSKYFTRVFEKTTGFKPKKYRELQHEY